MAHFAPWPLHLPATAALAKTTGAWVDLLVARLVILRLARTIGAATTRLPPRDASVTLILKARGRALERAVVAV
eukprot:CAMPEP_0117571864 /NCGR_PEP_ID=MMETSP0784-20121206/60004_1 /TAXON_ID=39447 /ORGANISM="" /LENGTH=73 /DNA_ID=CAMNT_0005370103 /DNA_START=912 /DNA_END=1133 /DNA_ORIENTATION=+